MTTSRRIKTTGRNTPSCKQEIKVTLWIQNQKVWVAYFPKSSLKDIRFSVVPSTIKDQ